VGAKAKAAAHRSEAGFLRYIMYAIYVCPAVIYRKKFRKGNNFRKPIHSVVGLGRNLMINLTQNPRVVSVEVRGFVAVTEANDRSVKHDWILLIPSADCSLSLKD
jgi:hypothetical protein